MNDEIDHDLTNDQWETLKALRAGASRLARPNRFVLEDLVALGLATISNEMPAMTANGRKALVRGSARLWDLAA